MSVLNNPVLGSGKGRDLSPTLPQFQTEPAAQQLVFGCINVQTWAQASYQEWKIFAFLELCLKCLFCVFLA